jgi:hypothetical protein
MAAPPVAFGPRLLGAEAVSGLDQQLELDGAGQPVDLAGELAPGQRAGVAGVQRVGRTRPVTVVNTVCSWFPWAT